MDSAFGIFAHLKLAAVTQTRETGRERKRAIMKNENDIYRLEMTISSIFLAGFVVT